MRNHNYTSDFDEGSDKQMDKKYTGGSQCKSKNENCNINDFYENLSDRFYKNKCLLCLLFQFNIFGRPRQLKAFINFLICAFRFYLCDMKTILKYNIVCLLCRPLQKINLNETQISREVLNAVS